MANGFEPTVGTKITKAQAEEWKAKYKKDKQTDTTSAFFGRDAIATILSDTRATGISFIFIRKYSEDLKKDINDLAMVGTDADGNLLWDGPTTTTTMMANTTSGDGGSQTYDGSTTCPPYCPK
jgi:hypothetical protein